MAQVLEFRLPDLGEGLTEAEIVRWLVEVGDVVAVDQPVVEVETAKAMVDVPCPYAGVVTARFGEEGGELPVGAPLITVAVGAPADGGPGETPQTEGSGNVLVGYGTSEAPARRKRVRPGQAVPVATGTAGASGAAGAAGATGLAGAAGAPQVANGSSGSLTGRRAAPDGTARSDGTVQSDASAGSDAPTTGDGSAAAPGAVDGPVAVISPLVRRLARENGLDLRELAGSGPDGLILRADVEYALRAAATRDGASAPVTGPHARVTPSTASGPQPLTASGLLPSSTPAAAGTRVPLKGVRGAVADKLSRSRREIPDATCWVDADATELMRARTAMNASGGPKISLLALLARISTAALARFPELNSTVDMEAREIVRLDAVHLGFAAQTERGLVVPVVKDAHARDAESLSAEFARLTEAARTGTLTPAELTGGTFTLNNYGVFGVDGSTPIVNHPEAAMLGVGRIVPKPWVHEGELAVRQVVQLSLTFDHRVCDGGTAGGFLRYVADCVEQPAVLLRTL
ncbi:dihydrolipoamide acetyltransferase family protein [Streptomyces sp. SID13726]|uniref:dihydrolipoamide acetyltransferase family protein n=1 Tax=Streptomyces sp. SID13726 TaxID=2706058 RepID=UPI0013B68E9E|nr:dihydrolipoamide acetyltransferase family protein [Streptomyces sp. SID13726]NEB06265.1 2-oxo acid dehydrogenase subunit E2 [Streptomyces sp. SID13726]